MAKQDDPSEEKGSFLSGINLNFGLKSIFSSKPKPSSNDAEAGPLTVDVAVIGAGPAGTILATLLADRHNARIALVDPEPERAWPNNYGVWQDEWQALGQRLGYTQEMEDCLEYKWEYTDLFLGGANSRPRDERLRLNRGYARVDRLRLKKMCRDKLERAGASIVGDAVDRAGVEHREKDSVVTTRGGDQIVAKLVVDCTGHETGLIERDGPHDPGFQIAYGVTLEVKDHEPYADDAMLFMDYRTDFAREDPDLVEDEVNREPTFIYCMPFGKTSRGTKRIFVEETSLVARPQMSFVECQERLEARLKHLGWDIVRNEKDEEEEFCYIPMGGALPKRGQRIIGFGGAGGIVHPATGYMVSRMLAASTRLANGIAKELSVAEDDFEPLTAASNAFDTLWDSKTRLQRDFCVFGGEFLMAQDSVNLRGFFNAFFLLPTATWSGFLANWPGLPNNEKIDDWLGRCVMGLGIFWNAPLSVKLGLMKAGVFDGGWPMLRSVTPLGTYDIQPEIPVEPIVLKPKVMDAPLDQDTVLAGSK